MKRFASFLLYPCLLLLAVPLAAQDARPQFNTIVVKHFTNTGKVSVPQDFIDHYSAGMIGELQWIKIANQVVAEGVPVADTDAAGSITIEGKFTQYDPGGEYAAGQLDVLINIYRISDGTLVKTIPMAIPFRPFKPSSKNKDQNPGQYTGGRTALLLQQNLRKITLSNIAPVPPVANHPAPSTSVTPAAAPAAAAPSASANAAEAASMPSPASAAVVPKPAPAAAVPAAGPAATADVQISSDPSEAAILFDGNYMDSTPSIIKLTPGIHEITIKKKGFVDWKCQLNATGGNIHVNAELERAAPASVTAPTPEQ